MFKLPPLLLSVFCLSLLTALLIGLPNAQPTAQAQPAVTTLQELRQTFQKRRPRDEGIRRGGLCVLTPGTDVLQKEYVIWSDRPLFLWQLNTPNIKVRQLRVSNPTSGEIIWEQTLQPNSNQILYSGTPLQAGQIYSWELAFQRNLDQSTTSEKMEYRFKVMDLEQRNAKRTELETLTQKLQATQTAPEEIALQQGRYFADQGLLSDALQVLYAIQSPSPATTQLLQELVASVCPSKS